MEGITAPDPAVTLQLPVVLPAVLWEQSSHPAASPGPGALPSRWPGAGAVGAVTHDNE